jgi:propanol-preferring alcohol dehydrogenase
MRAARFHPGDGLRIEEVPRPDVGPGDLLVEVAACGVCHSDLHLLDGDMPIPRPTTLGHEVAGTVVETGEGVDVAEGTGVAVFGGWGCRACEVCERGEDQLCNLANWLGIGNDGGYADYLRVPAAKYVLPLDGLDPMTAAPLTDAALTPYRAVRQAGDLTPADTVVCIGIGGLGQFGVQFAAMAGAQVVAVDLDESKLARARELGADATVNAAEERVPAAISDVAAGRVAAALDFVGSDDTLQWASNALGVGGHLVLAGIGGGSIDFSWNPLAGEELTYRTVQWGSVPELRDVLTVARRGDLTVRTEPVGFDDLQSTLDRLRAGEVDTRAVLTP